MATTKVTNLTKAPMGFNTGKDSEGRSTGQVMIPGGASMDIDLHSRDDLVLKGRIAEGLVRLGGKDAGDTEIDDGKQKAPKFVIEETMTVDELRAFIKDQTGEDRPSFTRKPELLEEARKIADAKNAA